MAFLDERMPGMYGVESSGASPDEARRQGCEMTAYSIEHPLKQAFDNGALGVLNKPFAMKGLTAALDAIRESAREAP